MNTTINYRSLLTAVMLVVAILLFVSCNKTDEGSPYEDKGYISLTGDGTFAQMTPVPATASTGTSVFSARFDNNTKILNFSLSWSGLTTPVTKADFYFPSDAVQNGWLQRNILTTTATTLKAATDSLTGVIWGNNTLSEKELSDLVAGKVYYVINTSANSNGEIRGQVSTVNK